MESIVFERINLVLERYSKTPNALANMLGMVPSTVNRQLKGDQTLSAKIVEGVLTTFTEVSAEWLLRGKGNMLLSERNSHLANLQYNKNIADLPTSTTMNDTSIWKAKYEAIKDCYEMLVSNIGSGMGNRTTNTNK